MSQFLPKSSAAQAHAALCRETFDTNPDSPSLALEWLCLLYRISRQIKDEGLIVVEAFTNAPMESPWLAAHPLIGTGPELDFCCDILRLMGWGPLYEIEWRGQYIRDARESYLTTSALPEILPAIGWFLMLINHSPETSTLAAWQQLPLPWRPDLNYLNGRLEAIRHDQRGLGNDRRHDRRQKIRHFLASLTRNGCAGEQK